MVDKGTVITSPKRTAVARPANILLACGILSSLLYVDMNVFVPMQWGATARPLRDAVYRAIARLGAGNRDVAMIGA